ncbi:MAG: DUF547 domain-containing protein [Candidatus Thorarchaeota archaeon]
MPDITEFAILKDYLNSEGLVDYESLHENPWLHSQIQRIEQTDLSALSEKEKFAFWLNAYNLLVLKSACQEVGKNPNWRGNTSFWKRFKFFYLRKHLVANRRISLHHLENKILREEFRDPRIHFAINCASKSCPVLPGKLFEESTLEKHLEELTASFVNNESHVRLDKKNGILWLNEIFKMYTNDFDSVGGVKSFINRYLKSPPEQSIFNQSTIKYMEYDWSLNSQSLFLKIAIHP